jgi:hypothetical protein
MIANTYGTEFFFSNFFNPTPVKRMSPILSFAIQYSCDGPHRLSRLLTLSMATFRLLTFLDVFKVHFFNLAAQSFKFTPVQMSLYVMSFGESWSGYEVTRLSAVPPP